MGKPKWLRSQNASLAQTLEDDKICAKASIEASSGKNKFVFVLRCHSHKNQLSYQPPVPLAARGRNAAPGQGPNLLDSRPPPKVSNDPSAPSAQGSPGLRCLRHGAVELRHAHSTSAQTHSCGCCCGAPCAREGLRFVRTLQRLQLLVHLGEACVDIDSGRFDAAPAASVRGCVYGASCAEPMRGTPAPQTVGAEVPV